MYFFSTSSPLTYNKRSKRLWVIWRAVRGEGSELGINVFNTQHSRRCNQSLDAPITTKDNTFLLGLTSFSFIFLSVSFKFRVRIGRRISRRGVRCRKKRAREEAASAALEELKKTRAATKEGKRRTKTTERVRKPEALERGKKRCRDENLSLRLSPLFEKFSIVLPCSQC